MDKKIVPVPEEFVEQFKELVSLDEQIYDLKRDHEMKSAKVWAEVEKKFDARGKVLKFNKEKMEITIIDPMSEEDEEAEMLKRIRSGKAAPYSKTPVILDKNQMGSALPKIGLKKVGLFERIKNSFK